MPPRKAMAHARKASKKLTYPLAPYPSANLLQLLQWARYEWWKLGRWQSLAAPVAALVALLTWEKERQLKEEEQFRVDRAATRRLAIETYGLHAPTPKRRKLFGIIPLPGSR